jgi:hypothetical protein
MFTPKTKMSDPMQWYKNARKLIPELPELHPQPLMVVADGGHLRTAPLPRSPKYYLESPPETSVKYLRFTMVNGLNERCYLVIDRTHPSM